MNITLYQPDIPQNAGAIFRLAACLGLRVDIIEPCGFVLDDTRMRRVVMDYTPKANINKHRSWDAWLAQKRAGRVLLLTTHGKIAYQSFAYQKTDTLLLGRESAGVPEEVHESADARLLVPMVRGSRSLNVVAAAAMVIGEALRQTGQFSPIWDNK